MGPGREEKSNAKQKILKVSRDGGELPLKHMNINFFQ